MKYAGLEEKTMMYFSVHMDVDWGCPVGLYQNINCLKKKKLSAKLEKKKKVHPLSFKFKYAINNYNITDHIDHIDCPNSNPTDSRQ